jgi:hypothetical protein
MSEPEIVDGHVEEFSSPNTAFAKDLDALTKASTSHGGKSELARKSLYVAFDPLAGRWVYKRVLKFN